MGVELCPVLRYGQHEVAGNNTGILVTDEIIERLGAGRRPGVVVNVNGYEYQNTVGVMGGRHIDLAAALSADPSAGAFFQKLSGSLRRYHVDNINAAKTTETRQRRIDKAVTLFREGKQR